MANKARKAPKSKATTGRSIYAASASDQFYTPAHLRFLAREVLGKITLDPCTSQRNPILATHHIVGPLHREDGIAPAPNGLAWPVDPCPPRLFLNPPYGRQVVGWIDALRMWMHRTWLLNGAALALLPARLGTAWYESSTSDCQAYCELRGRVYFEDVDGAPILSESGKPQAARWASVMLYWGHDRVRFAKVFRQLGVIRNGRKPPIALPRVEVPSRQLTLVG